jgi:regulator of cell morphogenesis and NO signaling
MYSAADIVLDVTLLEPINKHATIFQRFHALKPGENLIIHNDHDPKPLYYQMKEELGDIFHWDYLQEGPDWWKIRLTPQTSPVSERTLGDLVVKEPGNAGVFQKFGLDFCCGGKQTLAEACKEAGVDIKLVETELYNKNGKTVTQLLPYNDWELDFLCDFIVNTHHSYVRKSLPDLGSYSLKVAEVHGANHPELIAVSRIVEVITAELSAHMEKEENILFPYIRGLVAAGKRQSEPEHSCFGSIADPISMMIEEHEVAGNLLKEAREITQNYTLPEDACATYSLLFRMLGEFEKDLHLHIHLENNLLFPKAERMEEALYGS